MSTSSRPDEPGPTRGWLRAGGLLGLVFSLSVARPAVLLAVPLLALLALRAERTRAVLGVAALAALATVLGDQDAVWYAERAWALVIAGFFVALSQVAPTWRLSSRALVAVTGALAATALFFVARPDGWAAVDFQVTSGVMASVANTLDALAILREGQAMSPAFATAMYEMAGAQASVFPALLALASAAALCVAWWIVVRAGGGGDGAIGPVSGFRFNDHLVWVMIGGLVLVLLRLGDSVTRIGANAVALMGALYAFRGAGVVMYVTGGLSLFGYLMLGLAVVIAAPAVLGTAILIGIGDTWLDFRARADATAS